MIITDNVFSVKDGCSPANSRNLLYTIIGLRRVYIRNVTLIYIQRTARVTSGWCIQGYLKSTKKYIRSRIEGNERQSSVKPKGKARGGGANILQGKKAKASVHQTDSCARNEIIPSHLTEIGEIIKSSCA